VEREGAAAAVSGTWAEVGDILRVPALLTGLATRRILELEYVLALPSRAAKRRGLTAADVMMTRDISAPYYQRIRTQLQEDGVNRIPLWVAPAQTMYWPPWADPVIARSERLAFAGGHHRLRMLAQLGLPRILTTDSHIDHQMGIRELRQLHRFLSPEPAEGHQ
jgi:hypothetical protein